MFFLSFFLFVFHFVFLAKTVIFGNFKLLYYASNYFGLIFFLVNSEIMKFQLQWNMKLLYILSIIQGKGICFRTILSILKYFYKLLIILVAIDWIG